MRIVKCYLGLVMKEKMLTAKGTEFFAMYAKDWFYNQPLCELYEKLSELCV